MFKNAMYKWLCKGNVSIAEYKKQSSSLGRKNKTALHSLQAGVAYSL